MLFTHDVVAERAERERHDAEEHHDGAVRGTELVVELREQDATGILLSPARRGQASGVYFWPPLRALARPFPSRS
jgi:hypothetical protein